MGLLNRLVVLMLLATAADVAAQPQVYTIEASRSNRLELRVTKTGIYRGKVHVFLFPAYLGTLQYDAARPQGSQMRLTLKAASIQLTDTWLSEKDFKEVQRYALEDMLNVKKYPEITFVSGQIDNGSDAAHFAVHGLLTIVGVTKPAVVQVVLEPSGRAENGQKASDLKFRGDAMVKLTAFGLKPPKAALGLVGTQDEMTFTFNFIAQPTK